MEEKKKQYNKFIIIALVVLLIAALGYTFFTLGEHKKLTDAIEEEKLEIELNLDNMIVKYEDAIGENTSMSNELALERDKIIALRDSIKGLKSINYSLIRRYRKQIEKLEADNKELFQINEELNEQNMLLTQNLDSANVKILTQIAKNDTLALKNIDLAEKVTIGSILKVKTIKILAMREKSSGKLVETSRSKHTDAFRINFTISENEIANQGDRSVYIQIVDSQGNTLGEQGEVTLINETTIPYSDRIIVDYLNEDISIISLVEINRDVMKKGLYTANIYIDNLLTGVSTITLK
jgi:aryl carrier-like protein